MSIASRFFNLALFVAIFNASLVGNTAAASASDYGRNTETGGFFAVNGIEMYYEIYGTGEPVVLIHGSGQSIADMSAQISHFSKNYQVIVADSRAHGRSGITEEQMTYKTMASDWVGLINHLQLPPVRLIGWSDGGNISLEIARAYPDNVDRLAVMGANLSPDKSAVHSWAVDWVMDFSKEIDRQLAAGNTDQNWAALKQHFYLLRELPDMSLAELASIEAPVLVMAGDKDIIREEHTVLMYQTLPKAHLAIFPGETHFTPATDPILFNTTVQRFMEQPYSRPESKDFIFGSPGETQ
jgi:pimeloyl-ACP methyl ester carboxylesterase